MSLGTKRTYSVSYQTKPSEPESPCKRTLAERQSYSRKFTVTERNSVKLHRFSVYFPWKDRVTFDVFALPVQMFCTLLTQLFVDQTGAVIKWGSFQSQVELPFVMNF